MESALKEYYDSNPIYQRQAKTIIGNPGSEQDMAFLSYVYFAVNREKKCKLPPLFDDFLLKNQGCHA